METKKRVTVIKESDYSYIGFKEKIEEFFNNDIIKIIDYKILNNNGKMIFVFIYFFDKHA